MDKTVFSNNLILNFCFKYLRFIKIRKTQIDLDQQVAVSLIKQKTEIARDIIYTTELKQLKINKIR